MQKKTLKEMAAEYRQSADLLQELIEKYTKQMHKARHDGNGNLEYKLKRRIYDLYGQREHLIEISTHLKNYYKTDAVCI